MALAVHLNPGGYVPLLGSGVSRAAGIPTGWDIVLNLIRRVAALRGANELQDPEKWFIETIGARPTFTGILDALQLREEERRKILLPFIEAGGDATGTARTPTAAHRAIAALVKHGAIRLIITTNIDRLMEAALAEVGVEPVVLSSDAAFKAAPPLHETDCILAKLHGDYREPGVRLTAAELEAYPTPIRRFLRRHLSDFGLLVCGWSAEWDGALRDALESVRSYRFSSFWLHLEDRTLVPAAASTADAMRAFLVPILSADDALQRLSRDFEALAAAQRPHPATIDLAVERVRLSAGSPQPFADLDALVRDEAEALHSSLVEANRNWSQTKTLSTDAFMERLHICEQLSARFAQVLAAVAYYHDSAAPKVLRRAIERVAAFPEQASTDQFPTLQRYPALLVSYAAGIAALSAQRYRNLYALLVEPEWWSDEDSHQVSAPATLSTAALLGENAKLLPCEKNYVAPFRASFYLSDFVLHPLLGSYEPSSREFAARFDAYEFLASLVNLDLADPGFPRVGRFSLASDYFVKGDLPASFTSPLGRFYRAVVWRPTANPLLESGFFGGNSERLVSVAHRQRVQIADFLLTRGYV
jgi:hypothetical protein